MTPRHRNASLLFLALGLFALATPQARAQSAPAWPVTGLFANLDDSVVFVSPPMAEGTAGARIDSYVDGMAAAGANVLLCCVNARRTNYRSQVWDAYWDGYDPNGPDDQPFLQAVPKQEVAHIRQWIGNTREVDRQGIDYPAHVLQRARHDGMSPWISLRMNDCHYNDNPAHPFHGSFWRKHPEFARQNDRSYYGTCLDYAHPEVRAFYLALIDEVLQRYDMDGLELDFQRECYLFSAGREAEGAPLLTAWMRDVRRQVQEAAARRGHAIRLGVRVPSRPEVAEKRGLEAVTWAQEGLIDLLVATPRWATLEFDMPLDQWRTRLGTAPVTLAGGLEVLYRPFPGGPADTVSPELARGAAVMARAGGADAVYVFNYFPWPSSIWPMPIYEATLRSMTSLDTLLEQSRTVGITYRDVLAPGESYSAPLPAQGRELVFPMRVGPLPKEGWGCQLLLELVPVKDASFVTPRVQVNGHACELAHEETSKADHRILSFAVPLATLKGREFQQIQVGSPQAASEYRVERVEVSFTPGRPAP